MAHTAYKKSINALEKETDEYKQNLIDKRNELNAYFILKNAKIKCHELKNKFKMYKNNSRRLFWGNAQERQLYEDTIMTFEYQYSHKQQIVRECKANLHNAKFAKEIRKKQKDANEIIFYKPKIDTMRNIDLVVCMNGLPKLETQISETTNIMNQLCEQLDVLKKQHSEIYYTRTLINNKSNMYYVNLYKNGKNNIFDCLKLPNCLKDIIVKYTFA